MNKSLSIVILTVILYIGLFIVSVLVLVAPENLAMERVKQLKPLKEGYYRITPKPFYNEKTIHLKDHLGWYVGSYDMLCNRKDISYEYIMEVWEQGECIDRESIGVSGLLEKVDYNSSFSIHKEGNLIIEEGGSTSSRVNSPYNFKNVEGKYLWSRDIIQEKMIEVNLGEEVVLWQIIYSNKESFRTGELYDYEGSDYAFVLKLRMDYEEE